MENDLISREYMIERIRNSGYAEQIKDNLLLMVRMAPAVDAVPMDFHDRCMQIEIQKRMEVERSRPEVVRCGDCVHLNGEFGNMSGNFRCDVFDAWQKDTERAYMPLDGFCYLGQRREDGV